MIQTETLDYSGTGETFRGVFAWEDEVKGNRPAVLIAHTFYGQTKFETDKAVELAKLGYLGFAVDLYGKNKRAKSPEEAHNFVNELNNDRSLLLDRMQLSYETLKQHQLCDPAQVGGIGFCFGGKCVLDLARSGAGLKGIVTFHGVYDQPEINQHKPMKASVLILHGWDDPLSPPEKVVELAKELDERKADWTITSYGHTGHAFTNPKANAPERGVFYNEKSSDRAWQSMVDFLREVFG